jgi:hypothetical protein
MNCSSIRRINVRLNALSPVVLIAAAIGFSIGQLKVTDPPVPE